MRQSLMAGASSFASLLGRAPKAAKSAEAPDDDKKRDDESDEDYARRMEDQDQKKKDDAAAAKKAEEDEQKKKDEDARRAESGDDDDEGNDNSDDEDMRKKGTRSARMRERARIIEIVSAASDANIKQALFIALKTSVPRSQGAGLVDACATNAPPSPSAAAAPRVTLAERMAGQVDIRLGSTGGSAPDMTTAKGVAAFALAAAGLTARDSK
jgi:hypothetical protein